MKNSLCVWLCNYSQLTAELWILLFSNKVGWIKGRTALKQMHLGYSIYLPYNMGGHSKTKQNEFIKFESRKMVVKDLGTRVNKNFDQQLKFIVR